MGDGRNADSLTENEKGRPEGRPLVGVLVISDFEPAVRAAFPDDVLPCGVAAEEILQPLH